MYYSNLAELKVGESANFCHGVEIGTKMQKKHTYRLISEKSAGNLNLYECRPHEKTWQIPLPLDLLLLVGGEINNFPKEQHKGVGRNIKVLL
jgi:hypothetical protein